MGMLNFLEQLKDQLCHYVVYLPDEQNFFEFYRAEFNGEHAKHWQIKQYHRDIKQVCNIENFQVRGNQAIQNHFFASIFGYVQLQRPTTIQAIKNCYQVRRDLFLNVVCSFLFECVFTTNSLNPSFEPFVNA